MAKIDRPSGPKVAVGSASGKPSVVSTTELTSDTLKRLAGSANQSHNRFVTALEAEKTLTEEKMKFLKKNDSSFEEAAGKKRPK